MKLFRGFLFGLCLAVLGCKQGPGPAVQPEPSFKEPAAPHPSRNGATADKMKFKNMALCICLHQANPDPDFWKNEGSASGYLETGGFGLQDVEAADRLAKVFLDKEYPSCCGSKLFLMKCLDFYNSPELDSLYHPIELDTTH